jgi:hypothetical protein
MTAEMKTGDPASRLAQLHEASERISANLVELEIDTSRQLLERSSLIGESAAQWSAASQALAELWRQGGLLEGLLVRADKARRGDELRSLLEGRSIELASAKVPLAERALLGASQETERCSPDELLATMSASFDQANAVVASIGEAWDRLIPKLDAARRLLGSAVRLAGELGEPGRSDLEVASRGLEELSSAVTHDPLSVAERDVDVRAAAIQAILDDLEEGLALKRSFETRVLEARELLDLLRVALRDAQSARTELLVKISIAAPAPVPEMPPELDRELTEIGELAARDAWPEARRLLQKWTTRVEAGLEQARRATVTARAPIEARNQFRALLDAYQVKARRLGLLEDPELQEKLLEAREVLYTAPTDLALAAQLVRGYQQAVNGVDSIAEVTG